MKNAAINSNGILSRHQRQGSQNSLVYIIKGNSMGTGCKVKQLACYRPVTVVEVELLLVAAALFLLVCLLAMSYLQTNSKHKQLHSLAASGIAQIIWRFSGGLDSGTTGRAPPLFTPNLITANLFSTSFRSLK